ncbi:MAG: hypothetical protein IJC99_04740 [Clostridia bacterium]|nr:hypothetical protein [Clostridia bacterium]
MTRKGKWGRILPPVIGLLLLVFLTQSGEIAADGIKKGLALVEGVLAPALFPPLVFATLLIKLRLYEGAAPLLARPARTLFGLSGSGLAALLFGWVLGVPVGALLSTAAYRTGALDVKEYRRVLVLSTTPSMGFLVSAVGGGLFGSRALGWLLYLATLGSALLLTLLSRPRKENACKTAKKPLNGAEKCRFADAFTGAVRDSLSAFLHVAAFVLIFSALCAYLSCFAAAFAIPAKVTALLCGLFELTAGVTAAVASGEPTAAFLTVAFLAGFAGISICLQALALAEEGTLRAGVLFGVKLVHGVLAVLFAMALQKLLGIGVAPTASALQTLGGYTHPVPHLGKWLLLFGLCYLFINRVLTKPLVHFIRQRG